MTHLLRNSGLMVLCGLALAGSAFGQSSSQGSSNQGGSASAAGAPGRTGDASSPSAGDAKKKVWTNDDVGDLNGPVSVVGDSKNGKTASKTGPDGSADAQYIANAKKQLEKLQTQLDDTKKQLTAFKEFQQGKAPEPTGYQLGKGYNRVPVDQQIASLEEKKKDLEQKISDLLDEARKKGVLPGQLR
jgi:hypothetical protein